MGLDIPATIGIALRTIRDTGRAYGFDGEGPAEKLFRLQILELSALDDPDEREARIAALESAIGEGGRAAFYEGAIAEDIVGALRGFGGLHTLDDFAAHESEYVEAIATNYRGLDIVQCPPNGQGLAALVMLNILSGFDLALKYRHEVVVGLRLRRERIPIRPELRRLLGQAGSVRVQLGDTRLGRVHFLSGLG